MAALDDLLALQSLDTRVDQLEHQLVNLPVRAEIAEVDARRATAVATADAVRSRLEELQAEQAHLEDEATLVEERATAVEANMYDGTVVAHKDLEALQSEHRMLKSRQAHLEDRAIGVMEDAEPVAAELEAADLVVRELDAVLDTLAGRLSEESADVDAELAGVRADREAALALVPDDLLAVYTPLRARMGGIAVARLTGARCEGCRMEIPSAQLEEVRRAPADAAVHCPECTRILVR